MRKYKIRQKSTGLFFLRFVYERGFTKAGKPKKTGPGKYVALFGNGDRDPQTIDHINNHCDSALRHQALCFFEDTEIVAYEYKQVTCRVKLETIRVRIGQKLVIEALKAGRNDNDEDDLDW